MLLKVPNIAHVLKLAEAGNIKTMDEEDVVVVYLAPDLYPSRDSSLYRNVAFCSAGIAKNTLYASTALDTTSFGEAMPHHHKEALVMARPLHLYHERLHHGLIVILRAPPA
ncbi:hypothetical protein GUJ93_ZPchr0010g9285 [Zizania palustris]|uniref:Uncharacterized protein n=1 Tax=Zizania palustris TaxID=103762 RepID=A0A8J5W6C9_ZIZPA|nr:hypothetical protein GUJ93_ZPchr0010g9285 [Zizania palustris]